MSHTDLLAGLNEAQTAAVTHVEGPLLVLAGPGSGKTRVVTHRIAYLIQQGVDPRRIVALTFTNKAAQEMRLRIEKLAGDADLWMGTFHGFCVRLLRRYARFVGLPENFTIYDADDAQSLLKSAVKEVGFELTHMPISVLANRISFFKNRLITPEILEAEALSSQEHAAREVYPRYQQELLSNGAVDFDDILMHTALLLRSNPELRAQLDAHWQHVMVDEYQDTNLAQYVIVRHLSVDHPHLACTGDPDQSIYGWRGANAQNVTYLERDFPELKMVRLECNYRSTPEILSVADQLIQHNEQRKPKRLLPTRETGASVRMAVYASARQEAEDIAQQIEMQLERGAQYGEFAVLYRTNAQSRLFEHALLRRQIPFQLIGGFRFYLRKEIKDLIAYLQLVNNPDDDLALQRALNTPPRGIGKQTVANIQDFANRQALPMLAACRQIVEHGLLSSRATAAVKKFVKIFDQVASLAHGPLTDLLQTTIELTGYREYLEKQQGNASASGDAAENLDELLAEAYELDHRGQTNADEEEQGVLELFLESAALQADVDRLDNGQQQVTLMTLHAAKGLEFPYVFIAAVEENILPHSRSKDDPAALEEERRLLFVGITRAENQLQISYARRRGFAGQAENGGVPSSFLIELPRQDMQVMDLSQEMASWNRSNPRTNPWNQDYEPTDDFDAGWQDTDFDQRADLDEASADAANAHADSDQMQTIDWEDCQLPPEELKARLSKLRHQKSAGIHQDQADRDAAIDEFEADCSAFGEGSWVEHERFGAGQVISWAGNGRKRSITIHFSSDNSRRTFRMSHVQLSPITPPS